MCVCVEVICPATASHQVLVCLYWRDMSWHSYTSGSCVFVLSDMSRHGYTSGSRLFVLNWYVQPQLHIRFLCVCIEGICPDTAHIRFLCVCVLKWYVLTQPHITMWTYSYLAPDATVEWIVCTEYLPCVCLFVFSGISPWDVFRYCPYNPNQQHTWYLPNIYLMCGVAVYLLTDLFIEVFLYFLSFWHPPPLNYFVPCRPLVEEHC